MVNVKFHGTVSKSARYFHWFQDCEIGLQMIFLHNITKFFQEFLMIPRPSVDGHNSFVAIRPRNTHTVFVIKKWWNKILDKKFKYIYIRVWLLVTGQEVQQRRLAGPGTTDDRGRLAFSERTADAL